MLHLMGNTKKGDSAGDVLRLWRKANRISQMDLALDVGVFSRHLSFVETGKSQPSRSLVLRISDSLQLPLRQRNAFLMAAGYASEFDEEPFDFQADNDLPILTLTFEKGGHPSLIARAPSVS